MSYTYLEDFKEKLSGYQFVKLMASSAFNSNGPLCIIIHAGSIVPKVLLKNSNLSCLSFLHVLREFSNVIKIEGRTMTDNRELNQIVDE